MVRKFVPLTIAIMVGGVALPAAAQTAGAAGIDQVPASAAPTARVGVPAVPSSRSSATTQNPAADKVPPLVSPEIVAACQKARAADQPAPAGIDCVRALQVTEPKSAPSAEGTLLTLFGQNAAVTNQAAADGGSSVSADQVSRQLSSGDFQGTTGSDAAASVARDRPPPQTAPPPR